MAKANKPFKQYISVANNNQLYSLGNLLTSKAEFVNSEDNKQALSIIKSDTDMLITLNKYEIEKDPSIILKTTDKLTVANKIKESLDMLDVLTRDVYLALFDHWREYQDENNEAYIDIDDIHFNYRGMRGTNISSTLLEEDYIRYRRAIEILRNMSIKIDITNENNIVYKTLKKYDFGAIEGYLLEIKNITYHSNQKTMKGFKYNMSVIQDTFLVYPAKINTKYPTSLLQVSTKHDTCKHIGNYICKIYTEAKENNFTNTFVSFYTLMGESRYEIKPPRYQQYIDRFVNSIKRTETLLVSANVVLNINIPQDIDAKNYKYKKIEIFWKNDNL
jgi:hypothetical protein